jgi:hypothetical protein
MIQSIRTVVCLVLPLLLVGAAIPADTTTVAAPKIIIFHGELLPDRVVVANVRDNHLLLLSSRPLGDADWPVEGHLQNRPAVKLALFWGGEWERIAASSDSLRSLSASRANQHGLLYPSSGHTPALLHIASLSVITDSGLAVLRRHGIPVRIRQR